MLLQRDPVVPVLMFWKHGRVLIPRCLRFCCFPLCGCAYQQQRGRSVSAVPIWVMKTDGGDGGALEINGVTSNQFGNFFSFISPKGGSKCIGVKRKSENLEIFIMCDGQYTQMFQMAHELRISELMEPLQAQGFSCLSSAPCNTHLCRCCCGTHQLSSSVHPVLVCTPWLLLCNGTRTEIVGYAFIKNKVSSVT